MALTGTSIMQAAAKLLNDEDHIRWTLAELCLWINDGLKAIVLAKPSAKTGTRVLSLAVGTLQSVPVAAGAPVPLALVDVIRNITAEGPPRVGGRRITTTSRTQMDAADPDWHIDAGANAFTAQVRHVMFDEQNPLEFYVWPGNTGTGKIEAVIAEIPVALEADGDDTVEDSYDAALDIPDIYGPPLIDYVCYRAQQKDEPAGQGGPAAGHYQAFAAALGIRISVEGRATPNSRRAAP